MSDSPLNRESMTRAFGDCATRSPTRSLAYSATPVAERFLTNSRLFIVVSRHPQEAGASTAVLMWGQPPLWRCPLHRGRNGRHGEVVKAHRRHKCRTGIVV